MSKADEIRATIKAMPHASLETIIEACATLGHPAARVKVFFRQVRGGTPESVHEDHVDREPPTRIAPHPAGVRVTLIGISKPKHIHRWGMLKDEPVEAREVTVKVGGRSEIVTCFFWAGTTTFSVGDCDDKTFAAVCHALSKNDSATRAALKAAA